MQDFAHWVTSSQFYINTLMMLHKSGITGAQLLAYYSIIVIILIM